MDHEKVFIAATERAGRGLFAKQPFSEGETILLEAPLVALQSLENLRNVMVCANCFGFIGSLDSQLAILRGLPRNEVLEIHSLASEENVFAPIVDCLQQCGEVYCSEACRDLHFRRCHRMLCTGPIPDEIAHEHPLIKFKMHAVETNEIFLLVAAVLCHIITRYEETGGTDLDYAREPYKDFVQNCWWDVAGGGELGETLRTLVEESCSFLKEALFLNGGFEGLDDILNPEYFSRVIGMFEQNNVGIQSQSPVAETLNKLVGTEYMEYIRPVLEEAVYNGESESDADEAEDNSWSSANTDGEQKDEEKEGNEDPLLAAENCPKPRAWDNFQQLQPCCVKVEGAEPYVDIEPEDIEPVSALDLIEDIRAVSVLDGTSLYTLICSMNHSCDPNCMIRYRSEKGQPLRAEAVALKNIEAGKEIRFSYIEKDETLENRQNQLRDYGFICDCSKCNIEISIEKLRSYIII
eukprot:CAMPEP_0117749740 /NCGR_PEP_ID=MMETSP0947-20121206/9905_1 /TAXON_ID=44440 /ORGANISM="Chattonella subsalsa, Strain CCMP2191" /LENGTH=464 /DNA_ID=CAMNT_0005567679 /DNA_START=259 /DNA_END=1653 /DNA_ORIENTATION=-